MKSSPEPKFKIPNFILPWLDVIAIAAWGILLLKYWLTGQLNLLIHPDYFWLVIVTSCCLLLLAGFKAWQLLSIQLTRKPEREANTSLQHITLFPPGWSSGLLIIVAIAGLLITPKVFASQTAIERGVTESLTMTRSKPQQFRTAIKPEERSLVEWIRTLNVYPEPDAYTGQKVKLTGFVVHPPELSEQYILISRFVITCCAADAYPIGLPVKLKESRKAYTPDTWVEIEGQMNTETLSGKRQLIIEATALKKISAPLNPYDY